MRQDGLINELELRKAIQCLKPDGELFEIRIIGQQKPISGYFKDVDTLIAAFDTVDIRNSNVYITINQVNEACFSRMQSEKFLKGKNATSDTEIDGYRFLFIDIDPQRPTGISSSDSEYKAACDKAGKVCWYMESVGFEKPIKAISGNGAHLLYRINLKNTEDNQRLIEKCLKALALLFDDDVVQIDTANFNPSRVCKLYGTMAQKGANTKDRPHRMSRIFDCPEQLKATDKIFLEKLASEYPEQDKPAPSRYNNYNAMEFDIDAWLSNNGLSYKEDSWRDGCRKLVLSNCPFNHQHKAPDSMILVQSNGAIGFKCLHNSCQGKTWRDVRLMFEPDAYERNYADERIEAGWKSHNKEKAAGEIKYKPLQEEKPSEPMFQTLEMILNKPETEDTYIPTGITLIDKKMQGLKRGAISVVSGLRGSAKSTLLSQIILNVVDSKEPVKEGEEPKGHHVICYSGELSDKSFAKWMLLQAAGKGNVIPSRRFENLYFVPDELKSKIAHWIGNRFWLYNNRYGNDFSQISNRLVEEIQKHEADLVILDNLMALNLESYDKDKYEAQTKFVQKLKEIAELCNVHIIFVAHPRKAMGFLRLDDVAGSGNITNYVDNAFIVHRKNNDFIRLSKQMFGWKDDHEVYQNNVTNIIEICKDRDNGNQDVFIPLYYEVETKRLRNAPTEVIRYGWDKSSNSDFIPVDEQCSIPFEE